VSIRETDEQHTIRLIPLRFSSFLHAFVKIIPDQYPISGGSFGGGLGMPVAVEIGLDVNLSTCEKIFVWRVVVGGI
jgi:hypothetical protein